MDMFKPTNTRNQIILISMLTATGPINGIRIKAISKKSMKNPSTNTSKLTKSTKPSSPPGMKLNRCSIQISPFTARNERAKIDEPTRMNMTKVESLVVESNAPFTTSNVKRRRAIASSSAPTAPIAPPSVGVAQPIKMVPSTRKISTIGGNIAVATEI